MCIVVNTVYSHTFYYFLNVWAGKNGCRIGLDDNFPIRQVLPVGVRARWARFSIEKIVHYNRYNKFL
jgi:hypothetical protein